MHTDLWACFSADYTQFTILTLPPLLLQSDGSRRVKAQALGVSRGTTQPAVDESTINTLLSTQALAADRHGGILGKKERQVSITFS